jgi:hypothetical protein
MANRNPTHERVFTTARGKHPISVFSKPSDLVAVFRHQGRSGATQRRLAKLRERLPAWLGKYRLELVRLEEVE